MHRLIMNPPIGYVIDHINGNKLDNRKCNLRVCKQEDNCKNSKVNTKRKSSEYKGVHWDKNRNKWISRIKCNYKNHFLGRFSEEKDAAIAYNNAARLYHGEFACLNKI